MIIAVLKYYEQFLDYKKQWVYESISPRGCRRILSGREEAKRLIEENGLVAQGVFRDKNGDVLGKIWDTPDQKLKQLSEERNYKIKHRIYSI